MLRFRYRMRQRNLPHAEGWGSGPQGRINKMRKLVTALVRHERIEGKYPWLDESRGYAERLIQEAIKNGDKHQPTMELADYWLMEKDLVHKLFKVLVPRYKNKPTSFTQTFNLPTEYPGKGYHMAILELKDNPWPPVIPKQRDISGNLINVLLEAQRKEYRQQKYAKVAQKIAQNKQPGARSSSSESASPEPDTSRVTKDIENLSVQDAENSSKHPVK